MHCSDLTYTETPVIPFLHLCAGVGCTTRVRLHRHCDACLTTAAVELARLFEASCLEACQLCTDDGVTEDELRSMLAGIALTRPSGWYEEHSPLGPLSNREAILLRSKTDWACVLVARGGVAALRHMNDLPLSRALVYPPADEAPRGPVLVSEPPADYTAWGGNGDDPGMDWAELWHRNAPRLRRAARVVGTVVLVAGAVSGVWQMLVGVML